MNVVSSFIENEKNNQHAKNVFETVTQYEGKIQSSGTESLKQLKIEKRTHKTQMQSTTEKRKILSSMNTDDLFALHEYNTTVDMMKKNKPIGSIDTLLEPIQIPRYELTDEENKDVDESEYVQAYNDQVAKVKVLTDEIKPKIMSLIRIINKQENALVEEEFETVKMFRSYLKKYPVLYMDYLEHRDVEIVLIASFIHSELKEGNIVYCLSEEGECLNTDECDDGVCDHIKTLTRLVSVKGKDAYDVTKLYVQILHKKS